MKPTKSELSEVGKQYLLHMTWVVYTALAENYCRKLYSEATSLLDFPFHWEILTKTLLVKWRMHNYIIFLHPCFSRKSGKKGSKIVTKCSKIHRKVQVYESICFHKLNLTPRMDLVFMFKKYSNPKLNGLGTVQCPSLGMVAGSCKFSNYTRVLFWSLII